MAVEALLLVGEVVNYQGAEQLLLERLDNKQA